MTRTEGVPTVEDTTTRPRFTESWAPPPERDGRPLHVLVVQGDREYARFLATGLNRHGCKVFEAATGGGALQTYHTMDLVLLDLTLPDMDGLGVCRIIRATDDIPIIALAERATEAERILALRAGTDDCLNRPTSDTRELVARIEAVMRRIRPQPGRPPSTLVRGALYINPTTREVWVDDRMVDLTRKEFELLYRLAERAGTVVSRQQLMQEIWGYSLTTTRFASRTIDTHMNTLRRKLGSNDWIRTVRGVGFRFEEVASLRETSVS
jgi:DNA-binding response OmpR family regulator